MSGYNYYSCSYHLLIPRDLDLVILLISLMIPSLIWNCRGLGNPETQSHIARLINKHRLCLVGLIEPMIPSTYVQPFLRRFGVDHLHSNPTNHIWLFRSRAFTRRVLVEGPQHIIVMVQGPSLEFAFKIIYASYRPFGMIFSKL